MGDAAIVATPVQGQLSEIVKLCRRFGVRRLEVFGSSVGSAFDPATSDIDFLVEIDPQAQHGYADSYFGLKEGLEELFGRPVDLVTLGSVKNPHFLASIAGSRRLLYAA